MKPITKKTYFLILLVSAYACTKQETRNLNEDLVFGEAFEIKVPSYEYDYNGRTYNVRGDTSFETDYLDTLNSMPRFKWDSVGIDIITLAIFNEPIEVQGNEIVNSNNIIWQWHSGMEIGIEGDVQYIQGRNVIHDGADTIDYQNPVTPLEEGHYFWAIWGWKPSGTRIWYSSRQLEFYVSE
jgi:hypothetical protein